VVAHVKPASATILNEDVLPDGSVNNVPDKLPCVTTTPAALLITFAVPRVIVYKPLAKLHNENFIDPVATVPVDKNGIPFRSLVVIGVSYGIPAVDAKPVPVL